MPTTERQSTAAPAAAPVVPPVSSDARPTVRGKFLFVGERKLYVRGVTYGTFRPQDDGEQPPPETVEGDFGAMVRYGVNTVRLYTPPPLWLLDAAARHDLRLIVGLPWEQHVAFLDGDAAADIERRVADGVRACAGHPAVLCYAVGNEIPGPIVRWHGRRRVERFLRRLYDAAKDADPEGLVTYVNYPTTEYLDLSFFDFAAFNVYLEARDRLEAYLARLHNVSGDRPLLLAEVGLDSRRDGEQHQAETIAWQVRTAFGGGCTGIVLFAWTDEWHRGGHEVEDWDFGLTRRDRSPKPALAAARRAFLDAPFPPVDWPRISVVICTHNGARTIGETLAGVAALQYPNYEAIVVDDGSTDGSGEVARAFAGIQVRTDNRGLSAARNTGLALSGGELVAYLDDDASPDPHWLHYLAETFSSSGHDGVGGPNVAPAGDGAIADCVAAAPGGPVHVLESDQEAEHIPGCNMAFRRSALVAIGGFDPRFRSAGDDVDICWRLREDGRTIGFHPGALVWHRRRNSLRAFWRQQVGYGKAEALLEDKWRGRYNAVGHLAWRGRIYGKSILYTVGRWRARVYGGTWGSAPFQPLYHPRAAALPGAATMPEWYLVVLALAGLSALGLVWPHALLAVPVLLAALAISLVQALVAGSRAATGGPDRSATARLGRTGLTAALYLLQPLARLLGRLRHGLTPWRRRGAPTALAWPLPARFSLWREHWEPPEQILGSIETQLQANGAVVRRGGEWDPWDLEVRGGILGVARLLGAVEEHGGGRQLARLRAWPRFSNGALAALAAFALLAAGAALDDAWTAGLILTAVLLALAVRALGDCAAAAATARRALDQVGVSRDGGRQPARSAD